MGVAPTFSLADWVSAFQALMPRGRVWPREPDSVQTQVITALLGTHKRQADAAGAEIEDSFPTSAVTALADWEAALGLPDPCGPPDVTVPARQGHVGMRLTYRGGQSIPYFVSYAAALGFTISVTEFVPMRFGGPIFGSCFASELWANVWQVNATPPDPGWTVTPFVFGSSNFGDSFGTWQTSQLACELLRIKPAHTVAIFGLGGQPALSALPQVGISAGVLPVVSIAAATVAPI